MAILPLVYYPDTMLTQATELVTSFDEELATLVKDMIETLYAADGVGLAAPQIGVLKRLTVINVTGEKEDEKVLINPQIVAKEGTISSYEGCLSIPGYHETIKRHEIVTVQAQDLSGETFEIEAEGLFSRCIQHELDHLDGVLFIDHLSRLKQGLFKRWYKKNGPFEDEE